MRCSCCAIVASKCSGEIHDSCDRHAVTEPTCLLGRERTLAPNPRSSTHPCTSSPQLKQFERVAARHCHSPRFANTTVISPASAHCMLRPTHDHDERACKGDACHGECHETADRSIFACPRAWILSLNMPPACHAICIYIKHALF